MKKNTKPILQLVTMPKIGRSATAGRPKKTNGEVKTNGHPTQPFAVPPFPVPQNPTRLDGVRLKIFLDRYAWKDEQGKPIEEVPDQMWARVARAIAQVEKKESLRKYWEEKFYDALSDFKFLPGGRILSAAGTGYEVTYYNCFVIPSPVDSRGGIIDNLKVMMEIMSRAGGVGINLSSLRPRGARVHKVNGTSSGPVSWASLYSTGTHDVIQQGGTRRGALMLMLNDWHPDIEEFIEVKQDLSKINGANLSICASDSFMEAVQENLDWTLRFPDTKYPKYDKEWNGDIDVWESKGYPVKIYKKVSAKEIWDKICQAAWRSAEPGLVFMERYNKWSNTWYFEKIICVNPCVTGDTWVQTTKGPRQVFDLFGTPFKARLNGHDYFSTSQGFFITGNKQIFTLKTREGYALRLTANHKIKKVSKKTRYALDSEWVESYTLKPGDQILLNNHRSQPRWAGDYSFGDGYLMGLLIGDGTLNHDRAVLSVWHPDITGSSALMGEVSQIMQLSASDKKVASWGLVTGRNEYRFSNAYIKRLSAELGMSKGNKVITKVMEQASSDFNTGLLRGLFDTDGSVQGSQLKGVSVGLAQSNLILLQTVQRILLRLGIVSTIYQNRRLAGYKDLPNGKGGWKSYPVKAQHELIISGDNLIVFNELVGFKDYAKAQKLTSLLTRYKRSLNKEWFVATVNKLIIGEKEEVYDVQIPGVNAFDANGVIAHNCGEQGLGEWSVCNLGALNVAAFVENTQMNYEKLAEHAKIATRFLDNVVDANFYFYPENEKQQKRIRRTGLGTMGLGDALIKMKLRYGPQSLETTEKIYKTIRDAAYEASSDIAKEKGSFPNFNARLYLQGYFIKQLPEHIRQKIAKQGMRNAVVLTQAPTGTTSLLAGVSSGIEPVYDFAFVRRDRTGESVMYHPIFKQWKDANPEEAIPPPYFASANDLTPGDHVLVQAMIQKYTDSSISKTVNAPNSHTVKEVQKLYMDAYKLGCKGITYMRDGSREGVLSHIENPAAPVAERPMILRGRTYKVSTPVGEAFITINRDEQDQPFEVFVTVGRAGMHTMADAEAMGRLVSLSLRLGRGTKETDPKAVAQKIVGQLKGIGGASSVGFGKNRVMSLADAIAKVLYEDLVLNGSEQISDPQTNTGIDDVVMSASSRSQADLCPECGSFSFVMEEGCKKCHSCGYSMC